MGIYTVEIVQTLPILKSKLDMNRFKKSELVGRIVYLPVDGTPAVVVRDEKRFLWGNVIYCKPLEHSGFYEAGVIEGVSCVWLAGIGEMGPGLGGWVWA